MDWTDTGTDEVRSERQCWHETGSVSPPNASGNSVPNYGALNPTNTTTYGGKTWTCNATECSHTSMAGNEEGLRDHDEHWYDHNSASACDGGGYLPTLWNIVVQQLPLLRMIPAARENDPYPPWQNFARSWWDNNALTCGTDGVANDPTNQPPKTYCDTGPETDEMCISSDDCLSGHCARSAEDRLNQGFTEVSREVYASGSRTRGTLAMMYWEYHDTQDCVDDCTCTGMVGLEGCSAEASPSVSFEGVTLTWEN